VARLVFFELGVHGARYKRAAAVGTDHESRTDLRRAGRTDRSRL
jgi:hypothetical protein